MLLKTCLLQHVLHLILCCPSFLTWCFYFFQITPLTWLEAWLDNVMASVHELAICYHQNGVVQGYELLKTDDIFLLKGISDDGTPAFHPYVVQQNGLSVLRFLQDNCKQEPAAYWVLL